MSKRDELLEWAHSQVGPGHRAEYWKSAAGEDPGPKLAWCGAFCLAGLHAVGIAQGVLWHFGKGFVGPAGLKRTLTPSRGDIGYIDQPFQHHFLFDREADGWVYSVDGNQPDVRERKRRKDTITAFYSIEPLLAEVHPSEAYTSPALPTIWIEHAPMSVTGHLQTLLNRHGASLIVDGRFGPKTDLATRQFQAANDLTADGIVTAKVWEELER